jgi:putative aminopeptidase FrvX
MISDMSRSLDLLQELVNIPAPPGQEGALAAILVGQILETGWEPSIDAKGNVLVHVGPPGKPEIVVTAYLDELALMVTAIFRDGSLQVTNLGGLQPAKWGETPVEILATNPLPGILSFGSVHTEARESTIVQSKTRPIEWNQIRVFTGHEPETLQELGVRPGTRIAMARSCRGLTRVGQFVSGYFLDDRADLAAWLLLLHDLKRYPPKVPMLFAATVSEEVGGHGALYLLQRLRPEICVALELGPVVPDSPVALSEFPTVWANDSYAATDVRDLDILANLGREIQFQALSRGGSDASCAASHGLCARPVTLGIPMENTHGYEIIHRRGINLLVDLSLAYLCAVAGQD